MSTAEHRTEALANQQSGAARSEARFRSALHSEQVHIGRLVLSIRALAWTVFGILAASLALLFDRNDWRPGLLVYALFAPASLGAFFLAKRNPILSRLAAPLLIADAFGIAVLQGLTIGYVRAAGGTGASGIAGFTVGVFALLLIVVGLTLRRRYLVIATAVVTGLQIMLQLYAGVGIGGCLSTVALFSLVTLSIFYASVRLLTLTNALEAERSGLESRIDERTRDLSDANTALRQLDRLKDEFISNVSHELRTPLTSIRGSLGLLEGGLAGPISPEAHELAVIARSNADRLGSLVENLLDFDALRLGKLTLQRRAVAADEIVDAACQGAELSGVEIVRRIQQACRVEADPARLTQVLQQFLANAVKYSPSGTQISITAQLRENRSVRFAVQDRGPGIAESKRKLMFQAFQQLDGSATRHQGGTGIGLAIARGIIEQHGGQIGLESVEGEGSTFWFELPAAPGEGATPVEPGRTA